MPLVFVPASGEIRATGLARGDRCAGGALLTIENDVVGSSGGTVHATFRVGPVDTSRASEYVGIYVGTTAFVDRTNMAARTERLGSAIPSLNEPLTLTVDLPAALAQRPEVYVRVGVKTIGIAEMLFSPVRKVSL